MGNNQNEKVSITFEVEKDLLQIMTLKGLMMVVAGMILKKL